MKNKVNVFGISIDNLTLQAVFDHMDAVIETGRKGYVVTPNVDHVVQLAKDVEFQQIYNGADLVLNDSMILKKSAGFLGHDMREKLSGSDLLPLICGHSAKREYGLYFLGGMPGVAEKAKEKLCLAYPGLKVLGTYSPPFGFEKDEEEIERIIDQINEKAPHILFVGLGAPKQEKFAATYLERLSVNMIFCTGAAFDFQAGYIKRAPIWMQKVGLEWFYRFVKEPKRLFKRYFINDMKFFGMVFKEWTAGKRDQ